MAGLLSIVVLVLSGLFLAVMVIALVLIRKGEGPRYSASRAYDENRREAVQLLTGGPLDESPGKQWYDPARREARPNDPLVEGYRRTVADALRAVVPSGRDLVFEEADHARLAAEEVRVVPELSTADLRARDLEAWDERDRMTIGLVLFNSEPPGGPASRVALPIQVLFPALERVGRGDLIRRFEELAERASPNREEIR